MAKKKAFKIREARLQRRIHPKLRMILDGDREVNKLRSEHCGCLSTEQPTGAPQRLDGAVPVLHRRLKGTKAAPPHLKQVARGIVANVFLHLKSSQAEKGRTDGRKGRGRLEVASLKLTELDELLTARDSNILYVEPGEGIRRPRVTFSEGAVMAPLSTTRNVGRADLHDHGEGVIVGLIDVQGFDFAHPDFLDRTGKTRFIGIWDQGEGGLRPSPDGYDYGSLITRAQMNEAIRKSGAVGAPATELEPQTEMDPGSHGTHVASIAAGNKGVARKADIAAVLLSLGKEDWDPRRSFYDSTRIADAVEFLLALGEREHKAVSINISLGTNGASHDGSNGVSRWIDHAFSRPGRALSVAAGNAGQERGETIDDLGYVMGRIHTSGRIDAPDLDHDITLNVVGNGVADISENELEIWYPACDAFAVSVRPPGGQWIGPVEPRHFLQDRQLPDGSFLSVYNEHDHPVNGDNYIAIYLSPLLSEAGVVGVSAGTWTIRLHGREVRDGRFHGWIERDDPRKVGRIGAKEAWNFPSFFTEQSNVDDTSVSSLACGHLVIGVANLDPAAERVHISSSDGPTRDGRPKPDIAAPGTDIAAANGFSGNDLWIGMTGTSMASPYVCGVAALMLAAQPDITAAQIQAIMRRTAHPLPGHTYSWRKDAGYGRIAPEACVEQAVRIHEMTDDQP